MKVKNRIFELFQILFSPVGMFQSESSGFAISILSVLIGATAVFGTFLLFYVLFIGFSEVIMNMLLDIDPHKKCFVYTVLRIVCIILSISAMALIFKGFLGYRKEYFYKRKRCYICNHPKTPRDVVFYKSEYIAEHNLYRCQVCGREFSEENWRPREEADS